jgi:hypothetical protein
MICQCVDAPSRADDELLRSYSAVYRIVDRSPTLIRLLARRLPAAGQSAAVIKHDDLVITYNIRGSYSASACAAVTRGPDGVYSMSECECRRSLNAGFRMSTAGRVLLCGNDSEVGGHDVRDSVTHQV